MARYDVVDEAVIAAPPEVVWEAWLDEVRGGSAWWHPYVELHARPGVPVDRPGGIFDVTVHPDGRPDRVREPRFSGRVVAVEPARRHRSEYFAGWFRGTAEWTLEPADGGTLVRLRWTVRTHGRATAFALFVDMGASHSRVTQHGLAGLARHVAGRSAYAASASTSRTSRSI